MRIAVRVHPGADRTRVGGRYGDSHPPVLVVRVSAPAVDGRANDAVVAAVADAFSVPKSGVRIVSGRTSRMKILDIDGVGADELGRLLGA